MDSLISLIIRVELNDAEYRLIRNVLTQGVGNFLRHVTSDVLLTRQLLSVAGDDDECRESSSSIFERLIDACAFFQNRITANGGDDVATTTTMWCDVARQRSNETLLRLSIDAKLGVVSIANEERRHRPFITPLSASVVTECYRRALIRCGNNELRTLPTLSRHDWNTKFHYLTDTDVTTVASTPNVPGDTSNGTKRADRSIADALRAKVLHAYGRFGIVEPKLFLCKIDRSP